MKSLLIDPQSRTISPHDFTGELADLYLLLRLDDGPRVTTVQPVSLGAYDSLWLYEDGLVHKNYEPKAFFSISSINGGKPIAGKALVLGNKGETWSDTTIDISFLTPLVTWRDDVKFDGVRMATSDGEVGIIDVLLESIFGKTTRPGSPGVSIVHFPSGTSLSDLASFLARHGRATLTNADERDLATGIGKEMTVAMQEQYRALMLSGAELKAVNTIMLTASSFMLSHLIAYAAGPSGKNLDKLISYIPTIVGPLAKRISKDINVEFNKMEEAKKGPARRATPSTAGSNDDIFQDILKKAQSTPPKSEA